MKRHWTLDDGGAMFRARYFQPELGRHIYGQYMPSEQPIQRKDLGLVMWDPNSEKVILAPLVSQICKETNVDVLELDEPILFTWINKHKGRHEFTISALDISTPNSIFQGSSISPKTVILQSILNEAITIRASIVQFTCVVQNMGDDGEPPFKRNRRDSDIEDDSIDDSLEGSDLESNHEENSLERTRRDSSLATTIDEDTDEPIDTFGETEGDVVGDGLGLGNGAPDILADLKSVKQLEQGWGSELYAYIYKEFFIPIPPDGKITNDLISVRGLPNKLFLHQLCALPFVATCSRTTSGCFLADEQGLGKTISALTMVWFNKKVKEMRVSMENYYSAMESEEPLFYNAEHLPPDAPKGATCPSTTLATPFRCACEHGSLASQWRVREGPWIIICEVTATVPQWVEEAYKALPRDEFLFAVAHDDTLSKLRKNGSPIYSKVYQVALPPKTNRRKTTTRFLDPADLAVHPKSGIPIHNSRKDVVVFTTPRSIGTRYIKPLMEAVNKAFPDLELRPFKKAKSTTSPLLSAAPTFLPGLKHTQWPTLDDENFSMQREFVAWCAGIVVDESHKEVNGNTEGVFKQLLHWLVSWGENFDTNTPQDVVRRKLPPFLLCLTGTPMGPNPKDILPFFSMFSWLIGDLEVATSLLGWHDSKEDQAIRMTLTQSNFNNMVKRFAAVTNETPKDEVDRLATEFTSLFSKICIRRSGNTKMPDGTDIVTLPELAIHDAALQASVETLRACNEGFKELLLDIRRTLRAGAKKARKENQAYNARASTEKMLSTRGLARILPTLPGLASLLQDMRELGLGFTQHSAYACGWFKEFRKFQEVQQDDEVDLEYSRRFFLENHYHEITSKSPKLEECKKIIKNFIDRRHDQSEAGERLSKLVIFTNFGFVAAVLGLWLNNEFTDIPWVGYGGWLKAQERAANLDNFIEKEHIARLPDSEGSPNPVIILGTPQTLGVGVNLQRADEVIEMEPFVDFKLRSQERKRVHRIGQRHNVVIHSLHLQDCDVENALQSKATLGELITKAVDNAELDGVDTGKAASGEGMVGEDMNIV